MIKYGSITKHWYLWICIIETPETHSLKVFSARARRLAPFFGGQPLDKDKELLQMLSLMCPSKSIAFLEAFLQLCHIVDALKSVSQNYHAKWTWIDGNCCRISLCSARCCWHNQIFIAPDGKELLKDSQCPHILVAQLSLLFAAVGLKAILCRPRIHAKRNIRKEHARSTCRPKWVL